MDSMTAAKQQKKELLDAQAHIWTHTLQFQNSMALKCAIQLGIPDTIHKHGMPMTLTVLANSLQIPTNKVSSLCRLMRLLVNSNFFCVKTLLNEEAAYDLTINSQLLLKDHPFSQVPFVLSTLDETETSPSHHLCSWFQNSAETPFHVAHGSSSWEHASLVPAYNELFNQAMTSDTRFVSSLLVASGEFKELIKGVESLVDVGGNSGTMAKAIVDAYPGLKCTVFDLPHVIDGLQGDGRNLIYVAGDMFEAIPPADAVLLKWILHDWSDEHCIKILARCKEAIPCRAKGGKVIIIDIVVENETDATKHFHTQLLFDLLIMSLNIGGKERTEEDWKQLFIKAGFSDYKIFPILGSRSVIEVYPP